jgi:D-glycero-alpha-D-manno-heptose-7-phosphate kinase
MIVRARAPLRISFSGGGTDIITFFSKYGGVALSTTIDKFVYCTVSEAPEYILRSIDLDQIESHENLESIRYNGALDLSKAVVNLLASKEKSKFELVTYSEAPIGSGLGSSSSLMVCVTKAVSEFFSKNLTRDQIAEFVYKLEREELKMHGGYQDQYASSFGGFNFIEFTRDGILVNPLRIKPEIIEELTASLVLVYTGNGRLSSKILERQIKKSQEEDPLTLEALERIKKITLQMKTSLLKGDLKYFAELLAEEWENKKKLDTAISNDFLDAMYSAGIRNGALGGKVLGAGAGGHMLFYVELEKKHRLINQIEGAGLRVVPFNFELEGVVSWRIENSRVLV